MKIEFHSSGDDDKLTNINVARALIELTEKRTNCFTGMEYESGLFDVFDLEEIAKHLLVYCEIEQKAKA